MMSGNNLDEIMAKVMKKYINSDCDDKKPARSKDHAALGTNQSFDNAWGCGSLGYATSLDAKLLSHPVLAAYQAPQLAPNPYLSVSEVRRVVFGISDNPEAANPRALT
jgi:hypothetical protein